MISVIGKSVSVQQGLGRQSAARRILLSRSGLCPADDADHRLRPWAELAGGACRGEACAGITMALCHPVRRRMLRPPLYGRLARRRRAMGSPGRSIRRRGCVAGCGMRLGGCFAPTGVTGDQRLNAYSPPCAVGPALRRRRWIASSQRRRSRSMACSTRSTRTSNAWHRIVGLCCSMLAEPALVEIDLSGARSRDRPLPRCSHPLR